MTLMTMAEYSRHRGVSKAYTSKLYHKGVLIMARGMVNSEATDAVLDGKPAPGRPDSAPAHTLTEARREFELLKIARAKVLLRKLEGGLLEAEQVRFAVLDMALRARESFLGVAGDLCDALAATADPIKCREMIDERVREALTILSRGLSAQTGGSSEEGKAAQS